MVGVISSIVTSSAFAGRAEGTITEITSHENYTNVFLSEDTTNGPACATRTDYMSLSPENRNQLAVLLTAYALGNAVVLTGTNDCTVRGNAEDLVRIRVVTE